MIASGYTLSLYCDCRQCRKSPNTVLRFTGEFVAGTPDCRKQCFAQARRAGWIITRDGFCYAPGHSRDYKLEKAWRSDAENEIDID